MNLINDFSRAHIPTTELYYHTIDIYEHLDILREYASECPHITEFGVRDVVSTLSFLISGAEKIISYDPERRPRINQILEQCFKENVNWVFKQQSDLSELIEKTDLLFIDTIHTYDQLIQELNMQGNRSRKYIIIHDTYTFGSKGMFEGTEGLNKAISEFLEINPHWCIHTIFINNNGLTILKRKS